MESSLARLVDVLFDMLRVRKLFHRRMWFLMSHLSCSWREVLVTLFKEHIRKNLRNLQSRLPSSMVVSFKNVTSRWKTTENSVACYSAVPLYTFYLATLLGSFKISLLPKFLLFRIHTFRESALYGQMALTWLLFTKQSESGDYFTSKLRQCEKPPVGENLMEEYQLWRKKGRI